MKVRLIKPDTSPPKEKDKEPPDEVEMSDTIGAWVNEFKSNKANRARQDLRRLNDSGKK